MSQTTLLIAIILFASFELAANPRPTATTNFNQNWRFHLGDVPDGQGPEVDDSQWRTLNVPHDWSIEGAFDEKSPAGTGGGALNGGIGWYRKTFTVPATAKGKLVFIDFDGVYRNSEVWINGNYLGKRPYGYSSFQYELTRFLNFGSKQNVIAVKVDNSQQPNSRWYSGSGIYRNVWLTTVNEIHVDHWGTWISTPEVTDRSATVAVETSVRNQSSRDAQVEVVTEIYDAAGRQVASDVALQAIGRSGPATVARKLSLSNPILWSDEHPFLYKAVSLVRLSGRIVDRYETPFGVRSFNFDIKKGFSLNGKSVKIRGVCDHHDLGALGSAVNTRALERQLAIRTLNQ